MKCQCFILRTQCNGETDNKQGRIQEVGFKRRANPQGPYFSKKLSDVNSKITKIYISIPITIIMGGSKYVVIMHPLLIHFFRVFLEYHVLAQGLELN